tara:strand:+ start:1491 stop:1796 length:306 start_codon:yes stop_codon:yes gene_type:complete
MKHEVMCKRIESIFMQVLKTHKEGQKEYARDTDDVFANFKRVADFADITKEKAALTYLIKHIDGISAYVNGHRSQREGVRGRLTDAITYLCILWGMFDEVE